MAPYSSLRDAWSAPPTYALAARERAAAAKPLERFADDETRPAAPPMQPTYKARAIDAKYYCDTYGVCGPAARAAGITRESFTPDYSADGSCRLSEVPPPYTPMPNERNRAHGASAMDVSLSSPERFVSPAPPPTKETPPAPSPYSDDDFHQYLIQAQLSPSSSDKGGSPVPAPGAMDNVAIQPSAAAPFDPTVGNFATSMTRGDIPPRGAMAPGAGELAQRVVAQWADFALYVLTGILLLLLCDQLYRLAMLAGMKRTVQLLEPVLRRLAAGAD